MQSKPSFFSSVSHALQGLAEVARSEQNFRLHIVAAVLVIAAGVSFRITVTEWTAVIIAITGVMILEIINAVIERIVDMVKPRLSPMIKDIKDMMAAAVLLAAAAAVLIGTAIFLPRILALGVV